MQIPAPFEYARAKSMDDAIALLTRYGDDALIVAGGHSLLPMMKLRLARPDWLIDINELRELDFIRRDGDELRIGAITTHRTLLESSELKALFPIVRDAEKVVADPIVRNRGTIGGSLCQADPAEDLSTVCSVLGARVVIQSATGERTIGMDEFHRGPYETAVDFNEILVEVRIPIRDHSSSAYEKVERRVGDWAVAASGASVTFNEDGTLDDAAIGVTAVGLSGRAKDAEAVLIGQRPSDGLIAEAGRLTSVAVDPMADQRGSVEYKRHLASELTQRVLKRAIARAQGQEA